MQKFRFSNPLSVVEVSTSPVNTDDPKNPYTIYDCLCRGYGQNNHDPRKKYQITATSASAAARMAFGFYKKDCFPEG